MLDEYATTHPWLRVFHKSNGGVSSARNLALDQIEADGSFEYLSFVDPDDWVSPNFLQDFIEAALKHDADYVVCGYNQYTTKGMSNTWTMQYPYCVLDRKGIAEHYFNIGAWSGNSSSTCRMMCSRMFKSSIVAGLRFDPKMPDAEDQLYTITAMKRLSNGVHLPNQNYQYRLRKSSLSHHKGKGIAHEFSSMLNLASDTAFDQSVREGIKKSLADIWWQALKESYSTNDQDLRKTCLDMMPRFKTEEYSEILPRRSHKRFLIADLGETALRIYFFFRGNKNPTKKQDDYFP